MAVDLRTYERKLVKLVKLVVPSLEHQPFCLVQTGSKVYKFHCGVLVSSPGAKKKSGHS